MLHDARGQSASVCGVPAGAADPHRDWWLLARTHSSGGLLELEPLLTWTRAEGRRPGEAAAPRERAHAPELSRIHETLSGALRSGLARGASSRADTRSMIPEVAVAGHESLAGALTAFVRAGEEEAPSLLLRCLHAVECLRDAPRRLGDGTRGPVA